jgi:hypothetical protein
MGGPVTDPRAGELLRPHPAAFGGPELPVPVEAIAEDLLGLAVEESDELACSGLLVPAERRISVSAREPAESPGRRRNPPEEREADVVAAELPMPDPAVRSAFAQADSIEDVASLFDLSKEAMHWRLFNLELPEARSA